MAETEKDRAERREEIKLRIEYFRVVASLAVIVALLFAGLQWRIASQQAEFANQIANENTFARMSAEWTDHLKVFVEKPSLRAYFEDKKELAPDDTNRPIGQ